MQQLKSILLVVLWLCSGAFGAEELKIGVTDYCPVVCVDKGQEPHGMAVSVLSRAFPQPDYKLTYVSLPYLRSLSKLKAGELVAIASESIVPADYILWPAEYQVRTYACTYTPIDSDWRYNPENTTNLSEVTYGLIKFYDNSKVDKQHPENIVYLNPGQNSAEYRMLKMIASERLDTGFLSQITADYLIERYQLSTQLKNSGCGTKVYRDSIAIFSNNPKASIYKQKIDAAYRELRDSGEYIELMKSYKIKPEVVDLNAEELVSN